MNKLRQLGLGAGAYISVFGAILGVVAMVFAAISSTYIGYEIKELPLIIIFSLVGLAIIVAEIFLSKKQGNKFLTVYMPLLVACVLFGVCFIFVLDARSYLIGTLWATKLDASNADAVGAMNTGAPSFVLFVLSMVVIAVSSFFNFRLENTAEQADEQ